MKKILNTLLTIYLISVFSLTGCESLNNALWGKEKKFLDADGKVHLCSEESSYISSVKECMKCENERTIFTWNEKSYCGLKNCPTDMFQDTYDGNCFNCSEVKSYTSTVQECSKCGNMRKMFSDGKYGFCGLTTCPNGTFRSIGGLCISCSDKERYLASPEDCMKCGELRKVFVTEKKEICAALCENGMFQSVNGKCYPCIDDSLNPNTPDKPVAVPETIDEECNKCSGTRKIFVYNGKNYCVPIRPGLLGYTDKKGLFISL